MKFAKTLHATRERFQQPLLSDACIPYKQWKKTIKYQDNVWTLADLENQCKRVEEVFCKSLSPTHMPLWKHVLCCFKHRYSHLRRVASATAVAPAEELLRFAEINTMAVMKLCKKLDKTETIPDAPAVLQEWRTKLRFRFMGSDLTTRLRFNQGVPDDDTWKECPICFEEYDKTQRSALLLPCGHTQCFQCFIEMTHVDSLRATLDNRLAIGSMRFVCPFCRFPLSQRPLNRDAFWPCAPVGSL